MEFELLGGRYQLSSPISHGLMSTIYRGRDIHAERVVAVKILRGECCNDPKLVKRFRLEAKISENLQHPNIVRVFDYGQSNAGCYIVMELVEGVDLRRYLRSHRILEAERAVQIAHSVALGLGAAHRRGIVHRDVKPQNVLIGRDGSMKLSDFGIVSIYKDAIETTGIIGSPLSVGTVQYFAPEQAQGEIVTPAADVYGLGIVMYEMLTGHPPFNANSPVALAIQHIQDQPVPPGQFNPDIPVELENIILRCLEKEPGDRFSDGSKLALALEHVH